MGRQNKQWTGNRRLRIAEVYKFRLFNSNYHQPPCQYNVVQEFRTYIKHEVLLPRKGSEWKSTVGFQQRGSNYYARADGICELQHNSCQPGISMEQHCSIFTANVHQVEHEKSVRFVNNDRPDTHKVLQRRI